MNILVILIVLFILFGGIGGYGYSNGWPNHYSGGFGGVGLAEHDGLGATVPRSLGD